MELREIWLEIHVGSQHVGGAWARVPPKAEPKAEGSCALILFCRATQRSGTGGREVRRRERSHKELSFSGGQRHCGCGCH